METEVREKVQCPDCGREFKSPRGLWTHQRFHCSAGTTTEPAPPKCTHEWRLLNPRVAEHAAAIKIGYNKFCGKCGDVE